MRDLVASFPSQLSESLDIAKDAKLFETDANFQNVLITGLGGSGIGGTIVSELVANQAKFPVFVNKNYSIPAWVGKNTLVIVSSYSGNTEETLEAIGHAQNAGATIACVTSGGQVEAKAKSENLNHILLPGGNPPRSMVAYSLVQVLRLLNHFGITNFGFEKEVERSIELLDSKSEDIQNQALEIANKINGKFPAIYACAGYEGVAIRFRQQLNENSKILCWHHVIPEMNHNELVGWQEDEFLNVLPIFLRNADDYSRNQARVEINKEVILKRTPEVLEIHSEGESKLQRTLYLVHLVDWVSIFLGEKRGVDLNDISAINHLKSKLSEL